MTRIARPFVLASALLLSAGSGNAQSVGDRDAAITCFLHAYEALADAPLDTVCLGTAITLADYLSLVYTDKARVMLERAYDRATLPPGKGGMQGLTGCEGECASFLGDVSCREPSVCLRLAEIAARFDDHLVREYLGRAAESSQSDLESSRLLGMTAVIALRLLDGQGQAPVDAIAAYCKSHPTIVHGDRKAAARDRVLGALVAFDPDAAIRFAAQFDTALYGRAMADAAAEVSLTDPRRGLYYHRMAFENADLLADRLLSARMRNGAAWAFAREGLPVLLATLGEISAAESRGGQADLARYRSDFGRQLAAEKQGLEGVSLLGNTWRDICKAEVARNPGALLEVLAYPAAPSRGELLLPAILTLAKQGETRRALRLAGELSSGSTRARALSAVAQAMHGRREEKALSLFEEAMALAAERDRTGGTAAHVARQIYEVDRGEGIACFKEAIAQALAGASGGAPEDGLRRCALLLEQLERMEPAAVPGALCGVPNLRMYTPDSYGREAYGQVLPFLALSDPDMVYDVLNGLEAGKRFIEHTAEKVVTKLACWRPEDAARFAGFIENPGRREQLARQIEAGSLVDGLLSGELGPEDLLERFQAAEYPQDLYYRHPVYLALNMVRKRDPDRAASLARALPGPAIRDLCLFYLSGEVSPDIEAVASFARYIQDPEYASARWLYAGRQHALEVQEWETLNARL